jgi:hypothetical protein
MAKRLEGPAKKKVQSLASALEADNGDMIQQRWGALCRMLGQHLGTYHKEIKELLTDGQAERLARMTSFEL